MSTANVEHRVPQNKDGSSNSSPRTRRTRSNANLPENTPKLRQSVRKDQKSAREFSDRVTALASYLDHTSPAKPADLNAIDSGKMSSNYRYTTSKQGSPLGVIETSRMGPEETEASSKRAPPQDAPAKSSSKMPSHTPGSRATTVIPVETVYSEDDENTHEPILSPPFVLFSPSDERKSVGKEEKSSRKPRRKKAPPPKEPQSQDTEATPLAEDESPNNAAQEIIRLQEARIESLERENLALRAQLKRLIEMMDKDKMDVGSSTPGYESKTPNYSNNNSERSRRRRVPSGGYREHYAPRVNRQTQYSPGTKFVTELCKVLELETGHHTLLANIMDNHYYGVTRYDPECSDL